MAPDAFSACQLGLDGLNERVDGVSIPHVIMMGASARRDQVSDDIIATLHQQLPALAADLRPMT